MRVSVRHLSVAHDPRGLDDDCKEELLKEYHEVGEANYGVFILIPEGVYRVMYIEHTKPKQMSEDPKDIRILVRWLIVEGEYKGKAIFQSFKYYKKYNFSSKFFKDYMIANGGGPKRNDRMSPVIFKNGDFFAKVITVKSAHKKGSRNYEERPKECWYSVVECLAGRTEDLVISHQ